MMRPSEKTLKRRVSPTLGVLDAATSSWNERPNCIQRKCVGIFEDK